MCGRTVLIEGFSLWIRGFTGVYGQCELAPVSDRLKASALPFSHRCRVLFDRLKVPIPLLPVQLLCRKLVALQARTRTRSMQLPLPFHSYPASCPSLFFDSGPGPFCCRLPRCLKPLLAVWFFTHPVLRTIMPPSLQAPAS